MKEAQNPRALAPVADFERVKQKLVRKLRLWRMTVIAGAAMAALVPAAVLADAQFGDNNTDGNGAGGGIVQQIQHVLATVATHTTQIAGLQAAGSSQNAQIAALQQQLQTQNAAIAALQAQLQAESAARQAGDATGKVYTDGETARAKSAEAALAASLATVDNTATLNAAKAYTDSQISAEAAARQAADSTLQSGLNAEVTRAKQAEASIVGPDHIYTDAQIAAEAAARAAADASLSASLNNEIARATAAEQAAIGSAVGIVESNLTTIANKAFGGNPAGPQTLWDQIAHGFFN